MCTYTNKLLIYINENFNNLNYFNKHRREKKIQGKNC